MSGMCLLTRTDVIRKTIVVMCSWFFGIPAALMVLVVLMDDWVGEIFFIAIMFSITAFMDRQVNDKFTKFINKIEGEDN
jgi:hypothetical protein